MFRLFLGHYQNNRTNIGKNVIKNLYKTHLTYKIVENSNGDF